MAASHERGAPSLSVIIPAYDAEARVEATLWAIAREAESSGINPEVIVVDDGSTDATRQVVQNAQEKSPDVRYVFRRRDDRACRATARNLGIAQARAERLLFLDAGVLPGPGLLSTASRVEAGRILVFRTLGLFAGARPSPRATAAWSTLSSHLEELSAKLEWRDVREAHFTSAEASGHEMAAPWMLAWTCALAVSRSDVGAVGGFDEAFMGWGAEDIDFAARLSQRGAKVSWVTKPMAIHLPHPRSESRAGEHAFNARRLHEKLATRETELFSVWRDAFAVNLFASRLDRLVLPQVTAAAASPMARLATDEPGPTLCVGLSWERDLCSFTPDTALVHEASLIAQLKSRWPECDVRCFVGLALPFEEAQFGQAFVGDLLRLLPRGLQLLMLKEMCRVARRVVLLFGPAGGAERVYRELGGWSFSTPEEVALMAREASLQVLELGQLSQYTKLALCATSRAPRQSSEARAREVHP